MYVSLNGNLNHWSISLNGNLNHWSISIGHDDVSEYIPVWLWTPSIKWFISYYNTVFTWFKLVVSVCHFFNVLFLNKEYLSSAIDCKLITVGVWRGLLNVGTNEGMGEKRETGGLRSCSMISNGPGYVDTLLVITQPNVSFRLMIDKTREQMKFRLKHSLKRQSFLFFL